MVRMEHCIHAGDSRWAGIIGRMELFGFLIDFILRVDVHLEMFVRTHGAWVYALLFIIVFVETGVVVMPFLPGDSLLFVAGALCGLGFMDYAATCGVLLAAAILGDQCNYGSRALLRAEGLPVGAVALLQPPGLRPGACLLREIRRHHHHPGPLRAFPAHLRAVRGGRGADDPQQVLRLQRRRGRDLGVRHS